MQQATFLVSNNQFFSANNHIEKGFRTQTTTTKKKPNHKSNQKKLKVKTPESLGCFFVQQASRQCCIKQTLTRLGNLGAQAFPKRSQAAWKKASPKPNSQAKNSENNPNKKQSPKHKAKSRLCTQKLLQQQPKKEKKSGSK